MSRMQQLAYEKDERYRLLFRRHQSPIIRLIREIADCQGNDDLLGMALELAHMPDNFDNRDEAGRCGAMRRCDFARP